MSGQRSIGRDAELAELEQGLRDAIDGKGGLCLLTGEPGIGKTRLAEDSALLARQAGFACAWGRCWESGGAPAFWPWAQIVRALERTFASELRPLPASTRASLLPESAPAPSSTDQSRFELFDTVGAWLSEIADGQPLWLCIEDLHAADAESLALLEALSVSLKTTRVFFIGTLRDTALGTGAHSVVLQRIVRQARLLTLPRLNKQAATELLLGDLGDHGGTFVNAAVQASEGHPLFLVELARLARLTGFDLESHELVTVGIQGVLRQRLESLSEQSVNVLAYAALIGTDIDHDLLSSLFDASALEIALMEAVRDSLIRQLARRCWRFSHAMLRDVLESTLNNAALEKAHAEIAEALIRHAGSPAAVAHHLHRAGAARLEAACTASFDAARASLSRFAFEDALAHLGMVQQNLHAGQHPLQRARSGVLETYALLGLGRHEQALSACLAAAELARRAGAPHVFAEAALAYGSVFRYATVDPRLVQLLEQALELLEPGDSALRAQLLARLAAARQPDRVPARPIALAREAIAMAERVGDQEVRVGTLRAACSALVDLAHPADRRELDQRHLDLAAQLGLGTDELRARLRLAFDCFELGDLPAARAHLERAQKLAEHGAHPRYRWLVPALHALRQLWEGNLRHTRQLIDEARELGDASGDPNARLVHAFQLARFIELSGDLQSASEVASALGSVMAGAAAGVHWSRLCSVRFLLDIGKADEALIGIDRATVYAVYEAGDRTMLYGVARWAAAAGDAQLGKLVLERFRDQNQLFVSDGVVGLCWRGPLSLVLAFAAAASGELKAALDWAIASARSAEQVGGGPAAAESYMLAASLCERLHQPEAAESHRCKASQLSNDLGLNGLARRLSSSPAAASSSRVTSPEQTDLPSFDQEGDIIRVTWRGRTVRVKASKGLAVIRHLVAHPGIDFHVLDLTHLGRAPVPADRGDAGELLDGQARAAYRARASELREELAEAERHSDLGRTEKLRAELEFIVQELSKGSALGARDRRAPSAEERARQAIRKQIRSSLDHLTELYPELARYLGRALQTGRTCKFEP